MIQQSREDFETDVKNQIEEAKKLSIQENKLTIPEELKSPDSDLKAQITNKIENEDIQKALAESAKGFQNQNEALDSEEEMLRMALK